MRPLPELAAKGAEVLLNLNASPFTPGKRHERDALIRVTRNGIVIENDRKLEQLKRVKDDAKEVRAGLECGMKIVGYDDIKEGDVLECYKTVEVKRTL